MTCVWALTSCNISIDRILGEKSEFICAFLRSEEPAFPHWNQESVPVNLQTAGRLSVGSQPCSIVSTRSDLRLAASAQSFCSSIHQAFACTESPRATVSPSLPCSCFSITLELGLEGRPCSLHSTDSLFLLCAYNMKTVVSYCLWSWKKKMTHLNVNRIIGVRSLWAESGKHTYPVGSERLTLHN